MSQVPDDRREGAGLEQRATLRGLRGGGIKPPSLKLWRVRSRISQRELAGRVDVRLDYIQRVEQGRRGCNWSVAQIFRTLGV
jgi:hypothetical protein